MNSIILNVFLVTKISVKYIPGLIANTYIFAVILGIILLSVAVLIASQIKYQGGANPKDPMKRKVWFWTLAGLTPTAFYLYNMLMVIPNVKKGKALALFYMHSALSPVVALVVFIALGVVLSKIFKTKKIGNWFNKKA